MTPPVTVGLDGFPESRAAAEWAAREAVLREAPLRLVHVEQWPLIPSVPPVDHLENVEWPDIEEFRRQVDAVLEEVSDDLRRRHAGLAVSARRLTGRAAAVLAVEAADSQMLVLGSRGRGAVERFVIGSVGTATIGLTDTPVVVVRPQDEVAPGSPEYAGRDVVVGVDIHENADAVLAFAFGEAARRGCGVRAVHGWSLPFAFSYAPGLDPGVRQEVADGIAAALGERLRPSRERYPSVKVQERVLVGAPAEQVLYEAADAELVVVGRRIRRAPVGGHLGHVAHAVLHHATAPVAVIAHD
ncbi:universal stress protein [Streptomyces wuyuanensis]|uniref:Nucleotide-binding universal stress protein, UspA family n=1 Tax=Streptomyces wuyuanensis TaxID=1196353 RepID=A0A1G9YH81_9ACTN|nr:universal stress protein [Streptomyces wuyuanensis]SDN07871.1 Nucleotide-binding universal stress protein, UspA family [Streptomyces wuyuanensis]